MYINVGARDLDGNWIKTKKALKAALSQDPASVVFTGTSPMSPFEGTAQVAILGTVLSVCGPDPYARRNWYAKVRNTNGKITVE